MSCTYSPECVCEDEDCKEMRQLDQMFPDAKFTISIPLSKLNDVLTTKNSICLTKTHTCYCYSPAFGGCPKKPTKYYIKGPPGGGGITISRAIEQLIEQGFGGQCKHNFLEDICSHGLISCGS